MRCPSCGGHPFHLVTTVDGKQLYQCRTGMTVAGRLDPYTHQRTITGIIPCGLVCDNRGRKVSGKYVYLTNGKPEALTVQGGLILL